MERWQNQEEAYQFAMQHQNVMLDMDMGCGKTRTALDVVMSREDVHSVLVVCPKAVIPVWRGNIEKFYPGRLWLIVPLTCTVNTGFWTRPYLERTTTNFCSNTQFLGVRRGGLWLGTKIKRI